jgi:NadR type nicotinamide-nucleotide adenylyltransferase
MEKRDTSKSVPLIRIVITGPECTGKSTLSAQLAKHYNTIYIPEYAREYVENLSHPYTYNDVVHIARTQIKQEEEYAKKARLLLFYDTYLIITKVWFDVVYKKRPLWIDKKLKQKHIDLFLLCNTDIPWFPDAVRENGGEMREKLFKIYRNELEYYSFRYVIISGTGHERIRQCVNAVDSIITEKKETRYENN